MKRWQMIRAVRNKLNSGEISIGSWMQIGNSDVAEIMGQSGYDWIAVDLEHGSIGIQQLPDIFRSVELGGTLPLVRLSEGSSVNCKDVLDAGAGGVIIPMVKSADQIDQVRLHSCWPPAGRRGVGFSRANLFGKYFDDYIEEAQAPIIVAQIEHIHAVENIEEILVSDGLDAVFIGPYDLSASMGLTGDLDNPHVKDALQLVLKQCEKHRVAAGIHIVKPSVVELQSCVGQGYKFIAYSIDAVFLYTSAHIPVEINLN